MNPEQNQPFFSTELPPVNANFNQNTNAAPESVQAHSAPERGIFNNLEKVEQRSEVGRGEGASVSATQPVVNNTTTTSVDPVALPKAVTGTPLKARDTESIEKEWITKTKQVLAENKDDPYTKEEQVKSLKATYLKERFGRVIGSGN